jgi:poly(hydroxyalkanoate) depolymerase family esterase
LEFFIRTIILITVLIFSSSVWAGTWTTGNSNTFNGNRNYKVYIPENSNSNNRLPLIVMLHGCDQPIDDFSSVTRIAEWADKLNFAVLLPEQNVLYNKYKCWNWFYPINNLRAGEPAALIEIIDTVLQNYKLNKDKVFAAGISAGASMVNILGNCYPEKFKALASNVGVQYYATTNGLDATSVVLNGSTVPSETAASMGFLCSALSFHRPNSMPVIIFQGMNSPFMTPGHAIQVENEFVAFNDYLDNNLRDNSNIASRKTIKIPESTTYGYSLYQVTNNKNEIFIERYMIEKLGHTWSGGTANFPYSDPNGPDATKLMLEFFKRFGL